jgi:hypothetical protein
VTRRSAFLVLDLSSLAQAGAPLFSAPAAVSVVLPRKGSRQAPSIDLPAEVSLERAAAFADKEKLT